MSKDGMKFLGSLPSLVYLDLSLNTLEGPLSSVGKYLYMYKIHLHFN